MYVCKVWRIFFSFKIFPHHLRLWDPLLFKIWTSVQYNITASFINGLFRGNLLFSRRLPVLCSHVRSCHISLVRMQGRIHRLNPYTTQSTKSMAQNSLYFSLVPFMCIWTWYQLSILKVDANLSLCSLRWIFLEKVTLIARNNSPRLILFSLFCRYRKKCIKYHRYF
jgi:hypothetical protein